MKKLIFSFFCALCMISCSEDGGNAVVAKYKFNVESSTTRAVVTNNDPLEFVCEPGDKIEITIRVFDKAINDNSFGLMGSIDGLVKKKYERDLVYDGSNWIIEKDGKSSAELQVKGKEGDIVEFRYLMGNKTVASKDYFTIVRVKREELTAGSQTIVLDFTKGQELLEYEK